MVISVSNSLTHKSAVKKQQVDQNELQKIVLASIKKMGLSIDDVSWNKQGHLEIKRPDNLKLHNLMLKMEEMGFDLKMTKQTIIEIS